jgi:pimeloyl-ACP methyl ester carboxylesterase
VTAPSWQIGYATSSSGLVWTKHPGNPVITKTTDREFNNMMYPFVLYENGKFKMWYGNGSADHCTQYLYAESTNGYEWTKPANKNPVYTVTGVNGDYDKSRLAGLSIVRDENTYKIWYSGFDGSHWSIGYATSPADPITITPTPTPIEPVVIVPGTMASWNKEGILEGQPNPTTDWKILPFVKEYDGLVQTLKKLGYEEGKNLFLWPYDWRKSVDTSSQQLNTFIETKVKPNNVGSKIHLVGHSLGGLVTRAWTQTNSNVNQVHHLVTVATPHKGTIQPYKAWEGGDVAQENSFLSLATRIMIELNRRAFTTTRQAVQIQFPVLKDLLPTESYLKRQINGSFVDQNGMAVKNTWLSNLNTSASSVFPVLDTIRGVGFPQTPYTYTIVAASWLDRVLGNWQDGKPVDQEYADGDALVTSSRADFGDRSVFLSQNHSNVIADSSGVKQILQTLEIPATDANIVSGAQTTIQPGLLFLLRSPATLQVTYNDQTHTDFDGIIFIPNASNGTYEATVTGTSPGTYRLVVAQFSDGSYSWKEYVGNTVYGKKTKYTIPFSQTEPKEDPAINLTDKERLEEIDLMLLDLSKLTKNLSIPKARFNLKIALSALSKKDYYTVKRQLEQILLDLSWFRKSNPAEAARLKSFAVSDTLIDAYQAIFSQKKHIIDEGSLKRLQAFCNYEEVLLNKILEAKSKSGKNITLKVQLFNEGKTYKARAEKTTADEKAKKYILLFQTQLLFREIGL